MCLDVQRTYFLSRGIQAFSIFSMTLDVQKGVVAEQGARHRDLVALSHLTLDKLPDFLLTNQ